MSVAPADAQTTGFPGAQSLIQVESQRHEVKKGESTREVRYYLSSLETGELTPEKAATLVRGHWSAIENRTNWTRDAVMREDKTRSRNPTLLANLALIRNGLLALRATHYEGHNLKAFMEACQRRPTHALRLLRSK